MAATDITTISDRALAEWAMDVDRIIIEHNMYCCCDEECIVGPNREQLRRLTDEQDRRAKAGIYVPDDGPTFEERHQPFGIEWQLEQRDRAEHYPF